MSGLGGSRRCRWPSPGRRASPRSRRGGRPARPAGPGRLHGAGPGGVERADRRRVDESGPHFEPGGEAAGVSGPLLVEEVLEPGVQPHADDQGSVVAVGEQEGEILGGAAESTTRGTTPAASMLACSTRLEPRGASSTTSVATRTASRDGIEPGSPAVTTRTSGAQLIPSRSSAAAPTATITGACSRTNWRRSWRSACSACATTTTGRPASWVTSSGSPRPWSISSCSRRTNSLVVWASRSSWTATPCRPSSSFACTRSWSKVRPVTSSSDRPSSPST